MKAIVFGLMLCLFSSLSGAEVPKIFKERLFSSADLAEAVNHYVELGEEATVKELSELAPRHDPRDIVKGFSLPERVSWVCLILFQPKGDKPLRGPHYGALSLPKGSWPLNPLAASGDLFFVLSEGYRLHGLAEEPKDYLDYCRAEGLFRKKPVTVPTRDQAQKDLTLLRESADWKAIEWRNAPSEEWIRSSIQRQADAVK